MDCREARNAIEAVEKLREAIKRNPEDLIAWNNLGTGLTKVGTREECIDYWYHYGAALDWQGKHDEAAQKYEQVLAIKPDHVDAWITWGLSLESESKYDAAIEKFDEATRANALKSNQTACLSTLQHCRQNRDSGNASAGFLQACERMFGKF